MVLDFTKKKKKTMNTKALYPMIYLTLVLFVFVFKNVFKKN